MTGYEKEAERLQKRYDEAVGWCLQYGIPVHVRGHMRGLGELEDAIREHRGQPESFERHLFRAIARAEEMGIR